MPGTWSPAPGSHTAQLYETESFLHRRVARFMAEGARRGGPLVMIARRRTFEAVAARLAAGEGGPASDAAGRILFADADATLETIMDGPTLNPAGLERAFATLLEGAGRITEEGTVWIFGEMVDLLCDQGNHQAAVELEVCWNQLLLGCRPMAVVCAYAIERFDNDPNATALRAICHQHTHIMPTEDFTEAPDDRARFERVALLQQRARAHDRALGHEPPVSRPAVDVSATPEIYVIDDDASVRRSLARLLASVELPARTFESAEAFLAEVDDSSSGCLIVDVQLLGMSGPDLQRRLAGARERWPIIAMSGAYDAQIEKDALRLGAVTFLHKPFLAEALLEAILRARGR